MICYFLHFPGSVTGFESFWGDLDRRIGYCIETKLSLWGLGMGGLGLIGRAVIHGYCVIIGYMNYFNV